MNILALDTSMGACGVAVLRAGKTSREIFAREEKMARGHAEALMPMLAAAMEEARLDFAALDRIAATLGPGSFTGVRIAIAAARALALVTPAKLWGTDSLTVMARTARADIDSGGPLAVAVDARGGQLYFGLYDRGGRKLDGPALLGPDEASKRLPADLGLVVGSGAANLAEAALARNLKVEARLPELEPSAVALAELAAEADEALPSLHPLYLRPPDAKPQTAARVARQQ
jgi:tRNA threonylcarbamoyl adenosine modification protein YeaZ